MLTYKECAEFCDLSNDEIQAIERAAQVTTMEACALLQDMAETPDGCRRALAYMMEYLEHVETVDGKSEKRSQEVHRAINHFAKTHRFV